MIKGCLIAILGVFSYMDLKQGWIRSGYLLFYVLLTGIGMGLQQREITYLLGGTLPGIVLWISSVIMKERWMGKADGAVVFALGLIYGTDIYGILFLSSLFAAIVLLFRKKKELPFLPVLFLAVILQEGGSLFA